MSRLVVKPLTRVEGHGRVTLRLKQRQVVAVDVELVEAARLFEALVVGRQAAEVPDLVCRICAICSAVHKLTALAALEQAGAVELPPLARMVRELLQLGGHIQSHALHLFCLVLPDLRGVDSLLDLLRAGDAAAAAGLELKALGNRIQELAGGRVIHPVTPVLGGVVSRPAPAALVALLRDLSAWRTRWDDLAAVFGQGYPAAAPVVGVPIATRAAQGFALAGDRLWLGTGGECGLDGYAGLLGEASLAGTHAKVSMGNRGPFLAGALARLRLAAAQGEAVDSPDAGLGVHGNNVAQAWEVGWALERAAGLVEQLLAMPAGPLRVPVAPRGGVGAAVFEAPRGVLIHHYVVDDWGKVAAADVVTPTAINQRVMAEQIRRDLDGVPVELMSERAARIVRAYDPCISCAVHMVTC